MPADGSSTMSRGVIAAACPAASALKTEVGSKSPRIAAPGLSGKRVAASTRETGDFPLHRKTETQIIQLKLQKHVHVYPQIFFFFVTL